MTTKEKLEKIFGEIKESEWVEYAKVNRLIDELAKETKRAEYAEKVSYETSKKNADLITELAKERERYDELKAKYDALVMDNMTLEYNAAEAEKHLPDLIKQFVDLERERAAKLEKVVEKLSRMGPAWNLFGLIDDAKQALSEYRNPPETTGSQTAC